MIKLTFEEKKLYVIGVMKQFVGCIERIEDDQDEINEVLSDIQYVTELCDEDEIDERFDALIRDSITGLNYMNDATDDEIDNFQNATVNLSVILSDKL